ncbi:MAG: metallophosphoesterase family protein [bacterium]
MNSQINLPIAIIGDTQRTSRLERSLLLREQNDAERERLLRSLFDTELGLLVHLGDMVVNGSSLQAWQEFDRLFAPIFANGIPIVPLLGNHEYWGNRRRMLSHLAARFPGLEDTLWSARLHAGVGLIMIDSNISAFSRADWTKQINWFENTLRNMDEDPSVRAIVVFSHHPPFTNSATIKDAPFFQESFLPAFFSSPKTAAFISGHVHGYERFESNDKTFVVSGGGGGPRLRLHRGRKARHKDQFQGVGPRPFNYMLIYPEDDQLQIEVMGLDKGDLQIHTIDKLTLRYSIPANPS